jgi:photosystem II stability/assembly factor-like uncharacterized protein
MLPISHDTIIIGISTNNPYAYGCIYKSFDGGDTWGFAGLNQTHVYCFLQGVGDTIYTGTGYGIFKSGNYGDSWELILPMTENIVNIARLQSGELFAGFMGGIMRSLDHGMTWDTSLVLDQFSSIHEILPVSENEIYAGGTSYMSIDAGVFMSRDLGETWDNIGLVGYNIQALGYNGDHELFAGCYYDGLLKTADSGMTWETVFPHRDVLSIVIDYDEMYLGCGKQSYLNGGIFYSCDNGLTWEDHTYNITNKDVEKIVLTDDQYFYSLSRFSTAYGPPFYRSADPVFTAENNLPPDLNISIYPNPASDNLNISISPAYTKSGKLKFSIYDQTGHIVKSDSTFISPESQTFNTDITNLTPGIYYIKVLVGRSKYLSKLIVL